MQTSRLAAALPVRAPRLAPTRVMKGSGAAARLAVPPAGCPPAPARAMSARPGQPHDLTRYSKGVDGIPVPGNILRHEAEVLGNIVPIVDPATGAVVSPIYGTSATKRPVPTHYAQYEKGRTQYESTLSIYRKVYAAEVAQSRQRVAAAVAVYRDNIKSRKAELDALRNIRKAARAEATEVHRAKQQQASALRADFARRQVDLHLARVNERRQAWLDALEKDSMNWITEDKIDERITPELFSMKYAWQFERWFEVKERKKMLREQARRAKRPGQPLREIVVDEEDREYNSDWESDDDSVAVGTSADYKPLGAQAADADALADPTGYTAAALLLARDAAHERNRLFPEPAYDAEGQPIDETHDRVERMAAMGVQVEELQLGKEAKRVCEEYDVWCAAAASEAAAGSQAAAAPATQDDGERAVENAYIDYTISSRNYEALYYALLRKRRRLERGGFETTLAKFDSVWNEWLAEIDGQGSVHVRAPVSTSGGGGGDADGAATGASDAASPATGAGAAAAGGLATPDIAALTDALLRSAFGTDASADAATSGSQGLGQEILRQASASSSAAAAAAAAGDADMEVDARNLAAAARVSAGAASKQGAPTPRGGNKQA